LQLQQVEAALLSDPSNEELLKLKSDLEEVIELTSDLIKTQLLESAGSSTEKEVKISKPFHTEEEPDSPAKKQWKVGDKCLAIWSEDGQYYDATIEEITNDGEEVSVIFDAYKNADVTNVHLLREISSSTNADGSDKKKHVLSKQREYQKKKKQKKLQRFKQLEEERETEKNKWLAFATKKKGGAVMKKSIFASPESVSGRVGIGTCGIGGKPMTEFTSAEKWRKGV